jgi:hypothetical protein
MKPLKDLNLLDAVVGTRYKSDGSNSNYSPTLMTKDLFNGLREKHGDSIENLTITSSYALPPGIQKAMLSFLESASALQTLRLRLFNMNISNLEKLPKDLRSIKITIVSHRMPSLVEADLDTIHSALPRLQELRYTVHKPTSGRVLCRFKTSNYGRQR